MKSSADAVLFAIQASIRLGVEIRKAYVANLKHHELVLPLPNFPSIQDWIAALNYFEDAGSRHAVENARIGKLLSKAQSQTLTEGEEDEFSVLHREMRAIDLAETGEFSDQGITAEDLIAFTTIRQWARGKTSHSTMLRRVAGTLIELAVDYYANMPGAITEDSVHGKALKGFLIAIDDVKFAQTPVEGIARTLLTATLETISGNPELLTGDKKVQELISTVTRGVALDANVWLGKIRGDGAGDLETEERVREWAQLVFRSVLENSAQTVLDSPDTFLNVSDTSEAALIQSVGNAALDVIVSDAVHPDSRRVNLDSLFSKRSLDKLVKAMLIMLDTHPELLDIHHDGFKHILSQVAKELGASSQILGYDGLPEIMRLVLEKTSNNLELLWPESESDPAKHLLIIASREVLSILANPGGNGGWKPKLNNAQISAVLDTVFDEVIQNPDWILMKAEGGGPVLRAALVATVDGLKSVPGNRVSSKTFVTILRSSLKAVARRNEFIDKIDIGDDKDKQALLAVAIGMVIDVVAGNRTSARARWVLARNQSTSLIVEATLSKLASDGVNHEAIISLSKIMKSEINKLKKGQKFSLSMLLLAIANANLAAVE